MCYLGDEQIFRAGGDKQKIIKRLKRFPDYRLMIDYIFYKYYLSNVKPQLYFRDIKRHREIGNKISGIKNCITATKALTKCYISTLLST